MERERFWSGWMGRCLMVGVVLVILTFLVPVFLLGPEPEQEPGTSLPVATLPSMTATPASREPEEALSPVEGADEGIELRFLGTDGTVTTLTLNEYLWGVVAAEMPASFHVEALKAQAVAARTYALRRNALGTDKHPDADVCGDSTCCQAYLTREQAMVGWGTEGERYADKITQAVEETDGLVCRYQGELIDALFFSSAAGVTSDAVAVWGTEIPYLCSVTSPEGSEVPGWQTLVTFTPEEFSVRFQATYPDACWEGDPADWFSEPVLDAFGAVAEITIGGVTVTGVQARQALGLRSTHFTVEADGELIRLEVTGYGHGVGMSQYGANALAQEGKGFEEILNWYYTGITVEGIT